jgi:flavorubredoxin
MSEIKYLGVNDREIDLFEGLYTVENGVAYNSYALLDEKIAIMDTVDAKYGKQWLKNIENELKDREPSYLIIHHMEPDHSSNIKAFMDKYEKTVIVASDKAFSMIKQFFGNEYADRRIVVKEGDTLSLGDSTLRFFQAPMVHWPEVMVSFEETTGTLFSADAFGKFGALDVNEEWACEARRYYFGIVGKYGVQVSNLLNKLKDLKITKICPLHGPILENNLDYYVNLYKTWSSYEAEVKGCFIAYSSVYGNTKKAAEALYYELQKRNMTCEILDIARCDIYEAIENAFKYEKMVIASTTYNGDLFPPVRELLYELVSRNYQKRKIGIIENGTWAPMVGKEIIKRLENSKEIEYYKNRVVIKSALTPEGYMQIGMLADEICEN